MVEPCMWFKEEPSQFSMGQTAQSITCSIMEKPHKGLDECPRPLLSCFRARNSGGRGASPKKVVVANVSQLGFWRNWIKLPLQNFSTLRCCSAKKPDFMVIKKDGRPKLKIQRYSSTLLQCFVTVFAEICEGLLWAVGSYSIGPPAGEICQILIF